VRSGAKTPVAGIIHALTLLAIVLFAAPLVKKRCRCRPGRHFDDRGLQQWRLGRNPRDIETEQADIAVWLADLNADGRDGPDFAVEIGCSSPPSCSFAKFENHTVSPVTKDYVEDSRVHVFARQGYPDYAMSTAFMARSFLAPPTSSRTFSIPSTNSAHRQSFA